MVELYGRDGGEFVVNGNTDQFQGQSGTTRLASGEFVIVWSSFISTGVYEVRGQRYSADGTAIGGDFLVTTTSGNLGDPRVEALASGGFVVSWTYDRQDGTGTDATAGTALRIHGQIFDSAAAKLGGELTLSSGTLTNHSDAQLAGLAGGGFALSYTRSTSTNSVLDSDVVVQLFDASGVPASPLSVISSSSTGTQSSSAVAALPEGGFVAIWNDTNSAAAGDPSQGVKGQFFDSAGAKVGGEFLVNTVTDGPQYQPGLAVLATGGFVVTWTHLHPGVGNPVANDVFGQIFDPAGAKVGGQFVVNTVTEGTQYISQVVALAGGDFVVAWRSLPTADADVKAQVFNSAGVKQGLEFTLNTETEGLQSNVMLAGLADGGFVATWTGQDESGAGVRAQLFGASQAPTDIALSASSLNENATRMSPSPCFPPPAP